MIRAEREKEQAEAEIVSPTLFTERAILGFTSLALQPGSDVNMAPASAEAHVKSAEGLHAKTCKVRIAVPNPRIYTFIYGSITCEELSRAREEARKRFRAIHAEVEMTKEPAYALMAYAERHWEVLCVADVRREREHTSRGHHCNHYAPLALPV